MKAIEWLKNQEINFEYFKLYQKAQKESKNRLEFNVIMGKY